MATFSERVSGYLKSPKSREMIEKVKVAARRPENKAKFKELSGRLRGRGRGGGTTGQSPGQQSPGQQSD